MIISRPLALMVGIVLVCGSAHAEALDTTATQVPYAPFPQATDVTTAPLALPTIVTNQGAPIQGLDALAAAMSAASRGVDGPLKQLLADAGAKDRPVGLSRRPY